MPSPPTIDLDVLLAPVSEDSPAGTDIREDRTPSSVYYQIKDLRAEARDIERQVEAGNLDPSEARKPWQDLTKVAPEILTSNAKDLEVAAWLTEGLLRLHGIGGLRDGFRLLHGLVETYWDGLFPAEDEDGLITKVAPVTGLNGEDGDGTLIMPIKRVPITVAGAMDPLTVWHYQQARELDMLEDETRREQRISAGAVTRAQFEAAVHETGTAFYEALLDDLTEARAAYEQLIGLLDEKCEQDSPPASRIRETLDDSLSIVRLIAREVLLIADHDSESDDEAAGNADPDAAAPGGQTRGGPAMTGAISSREEAFKVLEKVADYFRRAEPHSPLSYLVNKAVRWGRMDLSRLAAELMPDDEARREYSKLTGVEFVADDQE